MGSERGKRNISLGALKPTSIPALGVQTDEKKISLEHMAKLMRCKVGELEDLQDVFYSLGKPPGAPLTRTRLMQLYHTLGIQASMPEVRAGFEEVSSDGETIDFYEFVALMQTKFPAEQQLDELKEVFSAFDEDEDGLVNVKDVARTVGKVFANFTEQEAHEAITGLDKTTHNQLNFEDFRKFTTEYWKDETLQKPAAQEKPPEGAIKPKG
ncbi:hypothetical protein M514_10460 [Trichuris suis]|uniref:EF-hand domain-containing protein n=1 Tax=Trichuris suis TaxID=68888 RepID=A0A085NMH7_9BILA|nr:hypothetical protein M513_10460 [Trichuris suis]KFD70673.1 hypothetical protein M514_10460 [Trichuris suis]KHJ40444.1 EF hand [Trichuris suis]